MTRDEEQKRRGHHADEDKHHAKRHPFNPPLKFLNKFSNLEIDDL